MSRRQRIVLLGIAAVILAAGIVLAASTGDDDPEQSDIRTTTQPVQTTAPGEKPKDDDSDQPPPERVETIRIRGGAPVGDAKTLRYQRGDTIVLRFVSDAPGEVHVHGFDDEYRVGSRPRVVRFKASLEGIYEIEEHGSGEMLARLEIRPK